MVGRDENILSVFNIENVLNPRKIDSFEFKSNIEVFKIFKINKNFIIIYSTASGNFGCEILEIQTKKRDFKSNTTKFGIKCVLIGESGAGKTTTGNCIEYNEFDDTIPSTHAMHFFNKECDDEFEVEVGEKKIKSQIYFDIWDFAGQPTYHISHKQNFNDTRIIFFVIDMSRDLYTQNAVNYWINSVKEHIYEMKKEQLKIYLIATKLSNKQEDKEKLSKLKKEMEKVLDIEDIKDIEIIFFDRKDKGCEFYTIDLKNKDIKSIFSNYIKTKFKVLKENIVYDKVKEIIDKTLLLREKKFYFESKESFLNELNKNEKKYDKRDVNLACEVLEESNTIEILKTDNNEYIILKPYWRHIFVNSILDYVRENKIVKGAISLEDLLNFNFDVKFDKPLKKEIEKIENNTKKSDESIYEDEFKKAPDELKRVFILDIVKRIMQDKLAYLKNRTLVFPSRFDYKKDEFDKRDYFEIQNLELKSHNNIEVTIGKIVVSLYYSDEFDVIKHLDKGVKIKSKYNNDFLIEFETFKNDYYVSIKIYAKKDDKESINRFVSFINMVLKKNLTMLYENRKYTITHHDNEKVGTISVSVLNNDFFTFLEECNKENKEFKLNKENETIFFDERENIKINDKIMNDIEKIEKYFKNYKRKEYISILHLSDLHVEGDFNIENEFDAIVVVFEEYKNNLDNKILGITHIVISGDLTKKSEIKEFEKAYEFIVKLMDYFELDSRKIIVVPGNHDYSRSLAQSAYSVESKNSTNQIRKNIDVELNEKYYLRREEALWEKRFNIFSEYFYEKLYNRSFKSHDMIIMNDVSKNLYFILINTSVNIDHFYPSCVKIDEQKFINVANKITDNKKKLFVVGHHPVYSEEFYEFNVQMLNQKVLAYIHGHLHRNYLMKVTNFADYKSDLIYIGAGISSNPDKKAMVSGVPLRFNVINVLEDNLEVITFERQNNNFPWRLGYIYNTNNHNFLEKDYKKQI